MVGALKKSKRNEGGVRGDLQRVVRKGPSEKMTRELNGK